MRIAEIEQQALPLGFDAIADTINFKNALESLGNAGNHILNQTANHPLKSLRFAIIAFRRYVYGAGYNRQLNSRMNIVAQSAVFSLAP